MIPFQQKVVLYPRNERELFNKVRSTLHLFLNFHTMTLTIKEGGTASNTFLSMVNGTFEGDVEETRRQLLEYCELDTYAMVKILEKLLQV